MHIAEHIHTNRYRKSRAGIPHGNISINQSKITNPAILQNLFLDLNNPKYIDDMNMFNNNIKFTTPHFNMTSK